MPGFFSRSCLSLIVLTCSPVWASDLCPTSLRTVQLDPACVAKDKANCRDLCEGLSPLTRAECFQTVPLPCNVVRELSVQNSVRLSDLLRYYRQHPEDQFTYIYVLANELQAKDFSPLNRIDQGSVTLTAENFKLAARFDSRMQNGIMSQESIQKHYGAADSWFHFMEQVGLRESQQRVAHFPYLEAQDKEALQSELLSNWQVSAKNWQNLTNRFTLRQFIETRRKPLNARLQNAAKALATLDAAVKSGANEGLIGCDLNQPQSCQIPPQDKVSDQDLPTVERSMDRLEWILQFAEKHAAVKSSELTGPDESNPIEYGMDLSGFDADSFIQPKIMADQYRQFILQSEQESYLRLKAAVAAGSYQQFFAGDAIWAVAASQASGSLAGIPFLTGDGTLRKKSCLVLREKAEKAARLQSEIDALRAQFGAAIQNLPSPIPASKAREMDAILSRLNAVALEKLALGTENLLAYDRQQRLVFFLPDSVPTGARLSLDFVQIDDVFWSPNIPLRLSELFPDLKDIYSELGSLKEGGSTKNGPHGLIQMILLSAPYTACAKESRARMILRAETQEFTRLYQLEAKVAPEK